MPQYRTANVLAAALLLAGCNDPKEASKDNFRTALRGWFDEHPECINIGEIPAKLRAKSQMEQPKRALYDALTAAGLLSVESRRVEEKPLMGIDMSHDALIYTPTENGAKAIRKADRPLGGSDLCFAHRNVIEVTSYTEPADVMGIRATQTRYRYRLEDIAPWAQTPALRDASPRLANALDKLEGEDKASLILTSEGWRHERSLRN